MMGMQGQDEGPDVAPAGQAMQTAQTAWAVVIEPGAAANRYRWDAARGALVLERVERPDDADELRDADLARLPLLSTPSSPFSESASLPHDAALAASAPGLLALALSGPANPAGIWLELRILGAFRLNDAPLEPAEARDVPLTDRLTDYIALAIPTADPTLASVISLATLTPALRERAQRALVAIAPAAAPRIHQALSAPGALPQGMNQRDALAEVGWLDSSAVMERYRAARVAASQQAMARQRQAEAARAERLTTSAEVAGEALLRRLGREAGPKSPAEKPEKLDTQDVAGSWRGLAGISSAELRARGMAVYGEPEDLLRWLPARFARYLGDLLFPDERALFFAASPALTLFGWDGSAPTHFSHSKGSPASQQTRSAQTRRGWLPERLFGAGRARRLNDGLLLVTDRQALLLRDYAPASAAGTQLGFLARSWPLGRLVAVSAAPVGVSLAQAIREWPERVLARLCAPLPFDEASAPPEQTTRLLLALEGHSGIQLTGLAFPPEATDAAQRAVALLHGFIPLLGDAGRGDWRLRRVPVITAWRPTASEQRELESLGGMVTPAAAAVLLAATEAALAPAESILAQGRTPQFNTAGPDAPALLTLTPRRLLLASLPPAAGVRPAQEARLEASPLDDLTSVTLSYSLMGSWVAVARPRWRANASAPPACEQLRVAFPSPLLTPFRALANRARALLEAGPQTGDAR